MYMFVLLIAPMVLAAPGDVKGPDAVGQPIDQQQRVGPLDLIPANAAAGVAVDSLDGLKKKGTKFLNETGMPQWFRPSMIFDYVYSSMGITGGVDHSRASSIVIASADVVGVGNADYEQLILRGLVIVVPFNKLTDLAFGARRDPGALKQGKITVKDNRVFLAKGHHLYVASSLGFLGGEINEQVMAGRVAAIRSVAMGQPVSQQMTASRRKVLDRADLLVHMGPQFWGEIWKEMMRDLDRGLRLEDDKNDEQVARRMVETISKIRFVTTSVRLDGGLSLKMLAAFPKDEKIAEYLKAVRGGPAPSDLRGLPNGNLLLAYAAKGDGGRRIGIARSLMKVSIGGIFNETALWNKADQSKFLGAFHRSWRHLKGSRFAVYRTEGKQEKVGMVATVAILDTNDPDAMLKPLKDLADVANRADQQKAAGAGLGGIQFRYQANAGKIEGVRVDELQIVHDGVADTKELKRLFGADWQRLRLAVLENNIVVLAGSDETLLTTTLRNIRDGGAGLAKDLGVVTSTSRFDSQHTFELHASMLNAAPLTVQAQPALGKKAAKLTSMSVTVDVDRIQFDFWMPSSEIRILQMNP